MSALQKLPQLKIILSSPHHKHYRHILLGEESLCFVEDLDAFYGMLGYTQKMAKSGILPDEFIWEEYVHNADYSVCLQKHIVDYLHIHSQKFTEQYADEYKLFCEEHEAARLARGKACAGCKLREYCNDND